MKTPDNVSVILEELYDVLAIHKPRDIEALSEIIIEQNHRRGWNLGNEVYVYLLTVLGRRLGFI